MSKLRAEVELRKLGRYHEVSLDGRQWQRAGDLDGLFERATVRKTLGGATESPGDEAEQPTNAADEAIWYCVVDEDQVGPMTLAALGKLIEDGQVKLDDLVWQEGYSDWVPAEDVADLQAFLGGGGNSETVARNQTEATRLVQRRSKRSVSTPAILAGIIMVPTCIPGVGLLGVFPAVMGTLAIMRIRKHGGSGMNYALLALGLGLVEILLGIVSLVVVAAGTASLYFWR